MNLQLLKSLQKALTDSKDVKSSFLHTTLLLFVSSFINLAAASAFSMSLHAIMIRPTWEKDYILSMAKSLAGPGDTNLTSIRVPSSYHD